MAPEAVGAAAPHPEAGAQKAVPEVRGESEAKQAQGERVARLWVARSTTPAHSPSVTARSKVTMPGVAQEAGADLRNRAVPAGQEVPVVAGDSEAVPQGKEAVAATVLTPDRQQLAAMAVPPRRVGQQREVPSTARAPSLSRAVPTHSRVRVRPAEAAEAVATVAWAGKEVLEAREEAAVLVGAGHLEPNLVSPVATVVLVEVPEIPVQPPLGR